MIKPQTNVPQLTLPLVSGGQWSLTDEQPKHFTFLFFYRGYHCPICKSYLRSISRKLEDLQQLGITTIAISSDSQERATQSVEEWGISDLKTAYNLSIDAARQWGLYVSKGIKQGEPELFSEPGLFVIRPNGELYAAALQTMPFTRPGIDELVGGFKYIIEHNYPGRGEA